MMPEVETIRLRLRMFAPGDLDRLCLILSDHSVVRYLGVEAGKPFTRAECEEALNNAVEAWSKYGYGRWAVIDKVTGELIGLCGLRSREGTPELLYILAEAYWNEGLATEAAGACLRFAFEELEVSRIIAFTRHENVASRRVLEKLGMSYEGKVQEAGVDGVMYMIAREQFTPDESTFYRSCA
jgi:RimJ/RimL family protein N-acetyltransferase